jgi:hypothetical protein
MTPQQRQQKYFRKNRDRLLKKSRDRYHQNIETEHKRAQEYHQNNKEDIKIKRAERSKQKRKNDPAFRLKENVSRAIRGALKKQNSGKRGSSFLKHVNYTMQDIKKHIEKQFESWMNWSNQGTYNKKIWNDNDPNTWFWQIDHIIPQKDLPYTSMTDDNFKKCWDMNNLRPLSAKENFIRGISLRGKK